MTPAVRLRQVVLITRDLPGVVGRLRAELELGEGFEDRGVGAFGLENRVLAAGDCFLEVLTPVSEQSTGHRYLERHGRDGGYMAIFQFAEREGLRERAAELGIRVVWQADLPDVSGTHLDPRDVPGAIVSLDWADPPESWHWAGPAWTGDTPPEDERTAGGVATITISVADPSATAARWAAVLGPGAELDTAWRPDATGAAVRLAEAGQVLYFVDPSSQPDGAVGIVACTLTIPSAPDEPTEIGGVRFSRAT